MWTRKHALCGSAIVMAIILCVIAAGWLHRDPIHYVNFDKIQDGMTTADVEKLLGCAPGDYRTGEVDFDMHPILPISEYRWQGNQGDLLVFLDVNDRVVGKHWFRGEPATVWQRVRKWIFGPTPRRLACA